MKEILKKDPDPGKKDDRDRKTVSPGCGSASSELPKSENRGEIQTDSDHSARAYPGTRIRTGQKQKQRTGRRKEVFFCALVCLCVLGANLFLDLFFRFDLTQIGGLAFLSIALLWLLYIGTIGKQKENRSPWEGMLPEVFPEEDLEEEPEENEIMDPKNDLAHFLRDEITNQEKAVRRRTPSDNERTENDFREEDVTRILAPQTDFEGVVLIGESSRTAPLYLKRGQWILGKSTGQADICIPQDSVSRIHAQADVSDGSCRIMDLNSQNGTYVNGKRLEPNRPFLLQPGDHVRFAQQGFIVT